MSKNKGFMEEPRHYFSALIASVLVGLFFATAIIDYRVGVNWFIQSVLCFGAVAYMLALDDNLDKKQLAFWGVIFAMYASMLFRFTAHATWDIIALPLMLVLFSVFAQKRKEENLLGAFCNRFFLFWLRFYEIFLPPKMKEVKKENKMIGKVLWGLVVGLGLLLIIIPLMMNADEMFLSLIEKIFLPEALGETLTKIIVGAVIAMLMFGFIATMMKRSVLDKVNIKNQKDSQLAVSVITVLSLISMVFAVFAVVQFRYLFVGADKLPIGYNYAAYAVKGYWEQFALTLINIVIIYFSTKITDDTEGRLKKLTNILLSILIGLNIYLLVSSAYKMNLYQGAYGFTYLRCLVYLILLFEFISLILMAIKVFKREMPIVQMLTYFGAAYFAIVAMMNLEAFSTTQNIRRYEKTGDIDLEYIMYSCDDAYKQLSEFYFDYHDRLTEEQLHTINWQVKAAFDREAEEGIDFNIARNNKNNYIIKMAKDLWE